MFRLCTPARMATTLAALLLGSWSAAMCTGDLGSFLDEALQRALLIQWIEHGTDVELALGDLKNPGAPIRVDCDVVIRELAAVADGHVEPPDIDSLPPPSLASSGLEAHLQTRHERWYLVSPAEGRFDYARAALEADARTYGEVAYGSPELGLFLVNIRHYRQFRNLVANRAMLQLTHVMENFPFRVSMPTASATMQLPTWTFRNLDGAGYAIFILDTGISFRYLREPSQDARDGEPELESRVVYQACFSSDSYVLAQGHHGKHVTKSLCDMPGDEIQDGWDSLFVSPSAFLNAYDPKSTANANGDPCTPSQSAECVHGNRVAYIAAGRDESGNEPSGLAPSAHVVSIQVGSIAEEPYCSACVLIMPIDVLRALHHVTSMIETGGLRKYTPATPVAVNMSFQLGGWCDDRDAEPEACEVGPPDDYIPAARYDEACTNMFSVLVDDLRRLGVWTVAGAGNYGDLEDDEPLGHVSLPGCVEGAITVGAVDAAGTLWDDSKFSHLTDFLAPGVGIEIAAAKDPETGTPIPVTGTSMAAPVVTGALVLTRQLLDECWRDSGVAHDAAWLADRRTRARLGGKTSPANVNLDRLVLSMDPGGFWCQ